MLVNGRPVAEYAKDNRSFIEAREGTEYSLRFKNNTSKRVMAVFSVDGIDVLKGKVAAEADAGYIIDAHSSLDVKGYRIDETSVAAFKFGSKGVSYAVTVGGTKKNKNGKDVQIKTDKNSGVIGVRVFEEETPPAPQIIKEYIPYPVKVKEYVPYYPQPWWGNSPGIYYSMDSACAGGLSAENADDTIYRLCASNGQAEAQSMSLCGDTFRSATKSSPAPSALNNCSVKPEFDVATQWGSKVEDAVKEIPFVCKETSVDIEIYYATRQKLEEYGVEFSRSKKVAKWPSAFGDKGYCKTPPGYSN